MISNHDLKFHFPTGHLGGERGFCWTPSSKRLLKGHFLSPFPIALISSIGMSSEPKKVASNLQGLEWPFICLIFPGGFGWLRWVWNPTGEDGWVRARGNLHHSQPCLLWHTRRWARWGMTLHDGQSEVLGDIEELNCWFTYDQWF